MLDPVRAWHEEHMYFRRLLRLLQHEVDVFHLAEEPNYRLMRDIVAYLRDWADACHHPREDEAFRRLAARRPDLNLPVARLRQEHRVIAHSGVALLELLDAVAAGDIVARIEVEAAAATYLHYYSSHIATEEVEIVPLAAQTLRPEDWIAVRAAALPQSGSGQQAHEHYRALRRQIESEAA